MAIITDHPIKAASCAIVIICALIMLAFAATPNARVLQKWARSTWVLLALVTIAWSILGLLRAFQTWHPGGPASRTAESYETLAVGFAMGLFVSLLLSGSIRRMFQGPSLPQPPRT